MDVVLQKSKRFSPNTRAISRFVARLLLASVFVTAATAKLQSFEQFDRTLNASRLIPVGLTSTVGYSLIALEFTVALCLLVPFLQPALQKMSLQMAMLLSATFLSYSGWRIVERIPVPCSCFGPLFKMTPPESILLNLGLLLIISLLLNGMDAPAHRTQAGPAA